MKDLNRELQFYIEDKIAGLKKIKKTSYFLNTFARIGVIVLNLVIIALAIWVMVIQLEWYNSTPTAQEAGIISSIGLTFVLATFIVLTFFINVALSIYSVVMKFADYKHAMREIEYITIKLEEDGTNYSPAQFEKDIEQIKEIYLTKKVITRKEKLMKFIMGGK